MSRFVWLTAAVFLVWAAVVWVRRHDERRTAAPPHRRTDDEIDREALEEAERDVRDLGADGRGRPLEDAVGDDWGPGTSKTPLG